MFYLNVYKFQQKNFNFTIKHLFLYQIFSIAEINYKRKLSSILITTLSRAHHQPSNDRYLYTE